MKIEVPETSKGFDEALIGEIERHDIKLNCLWAVLNKASGVFISLECRGMPGTVEQQPETDPFLKAVRKEFEPFIDDGWSGHDCLHILIDAFMRVGIRFSFEQQIIKGV